MQIRDALEVACVIGEKGETVMKCGCSYEDVKVRDNLAATAKERTDLCEALHDRLVQVQ